MKSDLPVVIGAGLTQGSTDTADVYLLAPGNYTITVNPTNASQAGNVLVEVYEVE